MSAFSSGSPSSDVPELVSWGWPCTSLPSGAGLTTRGLLGGCDILKVFVYAVPTFKISLEQSSTLQWRIKNSSWKSSQSINENRKLTPSVFDETWEISAAPLDKYVDWEQMKDQRNRRQPERTDGCTGAWGRGRQQEAASSPSEPCTQELKVPSEAAPDTCAGGEWVWAPGGRLWKSPWSPPGPLQGSPYTARWLEITGSRPKE